MTQLMAFFIGLISMVITPLIFLVIYYEWSFTHWKKKNLPHLPPKMPFGNASNFFKKDRDTIGVMFKNYYSKMRQRKAKHAGFYLFASPCYMPIDPDHIKNIMAKDFEYFTERGLYYNEKWDPISANLLNLGGHKWKNLRSKLTPTFTSGKIKNMFPILTECTRQLDETMMELCLKKEPIDIKSVLACYTTDVIGSCAFGLNCNSFKEPNSLFRVYGSKATGLNRIRRIKESLSLSFPKLAKALSLKLVPEDVSDFFNGVIKDTVEYRQNKNYSRNDFLQLLMELKDKDGSSLSLEQIAAQAFVFFVAGFDTSSITMMFCLYELSLNEHIQKRVREEIKKVWLTHGDDLTYESLMDMKYLGQVIDETLRLHPTIPAITRECIKKYKIPQDSVVIEKGTKIFIPTMGLHHDPEYYPEPMKFDPERFSDENRKMVRPYTYLPFGEGPRICIGQRFSLIQIKVALAVLLRKYSFTISSKTKRPLKFDANNIFLTVIGGIWLNTKKIE